MAELKSQYELEREQRIADNKRKIEELGIDECLKELQAPTPSRAPRPKRQKTEAPDTPGEVRRSNRPKQTVNYCDDVKPERPPPKDQTHKIAAVQLDEETAERLRAEAEAKRTAAPEAAVSAKKRAPIDSGKGVRIQGGKVYDSKYGVTCHWCRQKTLEDHLTCTHPGCGRGKRLPTTFCKKCLLNRHGEDSVAADASGKWVCPQCRGSCGAGCVVCCNCGPCRKKAGLEPTHQIVKLARDANFSNVHDYLVHLVTGETAEKIEARKEGFWWGSWLKGGSCIGAENSDASAQTADELPEAGEEGEGAEEEVPVAKAKRGKAAAKSSKAPEAPVAPKRRAAGNKGKGRVPPDDQGAAELEAGQDCCTHADKAGCSAPMQRGKKGAKAASAKAAAAAAKAAEEVEHVAEEEKELEEEEEEAEAPVEVPLSPEDAKKARRQRMMQRMGLAPVMA